jgi:hypothetical protein
MAGVKSEVSIQRSGYFPFITDLLQPCNFLKLVLKLFRCDLNVYRKAFHHNQSKKITQPAL